MVFLNLLLPELQFKFFLLSSQLLNLVFLMNSVICQPNTFTIVNVSF